MPPVKSKGVAYPHVVAWLEKYKSDLNDPRTLEAGSGSGQYAHLFPSDRYKSFDISTDWYEIVHAPTVLTSSDALPFEDKEFDFAFSVAAFDYFRDPVSSLKEIHRCLGPGGIFLLVTYDLSTLEKIHQNATKRSTEKEHQNHHVYDDQQLRQYSESAGFSIRSLGLYPSCWKRLSPTNLRWRYFRLYELKKSD